MKSAILLAACVMVVCGFIYPGDNNRVVTVEWLAQHLKDPDLVLLQTGWTRGGYKAEHIPGAGFLWLDGMASGTPDLSTQLPTQETAQSMLRDLGITKRSKIVLCFEGQNVTMTARMVLTLDYFGLGDQVSFLDGGIEAWKRAGHPVTKEIPMVRKGDYTPTIHPEVIADIGWVRQAMSQPNVTIIDARSTRYYEGNGGGMPRAGHIPGAVNIPYSSVADSLNMLLPVKELKEMFVKAGVKPGSKIVTYCHVGQQASLLYFISRNLGYDARLFDGSFEEWSGTEDVPVENPSKKAKVD